MKNSILNSYQKIEDYFLTDIKNRYSFLIFQKGLYLYLILYTLYLLPIADQLWGNDSLSPIMNLSASWLNRSINLLQYSSINKYFYLFIVFQLGLLVLGLLKSSSRPISLFIYFLTINLFNKTYLMNTGAQQIVSLTLLFMCLVNVNYRSKKKIFMMLNNAISNMGIVACKIQIVFLYFFSALYKYYGASWLNGEALYYSLKVEDYNPIWLTSILNENNFFLQVSTYLVLAYLTLFPLFIWIKKMNILLLLGVFLHLGIAFIMGIIDFGLAMTITYLLFIPDNIAQNILKKFSLKKD